MIKRWFALHPAPGFWLGAILLFALYSVVYLAYPFSVPVNDFILNVTYLVSVISPAWIASLVLKRYEPSDAPARIWRYFSAGFWAWAAAEVIWIGYNMALGEVPHLNLADPPYVVGYVFMTYAVACQYRQTRYQSALSENALVAVLWVTMLLVDVLLFTFTTLIPQPSLTAEEYGGAFLNVLYGVGDMTLALTALLLVTRFQGGALGRPWWGFIILALADIFYGWLIQTGTYDYETFSGDLLRLTSDLIYMLSYTVIAYSFLRQYILLKFGPKDASPTVPRR